MTRHSLIPWGMLSMTTTFPAGTVVRMCLTRFSDKWTWLIQTEVSRGNWKRPRTTMSYLQTLGRLWCTTYHTNLDKVVQERDVGRIYGRSSSKLRLQNSSSLPEQAGASVLWWSQEQQISRRRIKIEKEARIWGYLENLSIRHSRVV